MDKIAAKYGHDMKSILAAQKALNSAPVPLRGRKALTEFGVIDIDGGAMSCKKGKGKGKGGGKGK